ncbi:hypothetical protein TWF730_002967 [Orbilia blumenaviensis]|uniref:Uncharacterized protein n=1 Tax=Orbilia blumenaviensis TaxID=1796055 RepID=A0AAV9U7G8_9PEZI
MLDDMEVEIRSAWSPYEAEVYPIQINVLMPLGRVHPLNLLEAGVIDVAGARWASASRYWAECFWLRYVEEWKRTQPKRRLSRFSVSLDGQSYLSMNPALNRVWDILHMLDMLDKIDELEVKNLQTVGSGFYSSGWFMLTAAPYPAPHTKFEAKNVKRLALEAGENHIGGLNMALQDLGVGFPSLEKLSIRKVGLFLRTELQILGRLKGLKHLVITEASSIDLAGEIGPDSMHATNLLLDCMELILHLPNLKIIEWDRGGYQRVYSHVILNSFNKIEFVDIWLTIGRDKIFVGERYNGWYFREELFYGTGSEVEWGGLWARRFVPDSEMADCFTVDEILDEEAFSEGSAEAIPW